jgi:hypothetical protein
MIDLLHKIEPIKNEVKVNSRGVCLVDFNIAEPGLYAIIGGKYAIIFEVR